MRATRVGVLIVAFLMQFCLASCAVKPSDRPGSAEENVGAPAGTAVSAAAADSVQAKVSGVWFYDAEKTYGSEENIRIMRNDLANASGMSGAELDEFLQQLLPQSIAVMKGGSMEFNFSANTLVTRTKTPPPDLRPFTFEREFTVARSDGNSITLNLGAAHMPSGAVVPGSPMKYSLEKNNAGQDILVAEMVNGFKTYLRRDR